MAYNKIAHFRRVKNDAFPDPGDVHVRPGITHKIQGHIYDTEGGCELAGLTIAHAPLDRDLDKIVSTQQEQVRGFHPSSEGPANATLSVDDLSNLNELIKQQVAQETPSSSAGSNMNSLLDGPQDDLSKLSPEDLLKVQSRGEIDYNRPIECAGELAWKQNHNGIWKKVCSVHGHYIDSVHAKAHEWAQQFGEVPDNPDNRALSEKVYQKRIDRVQRRDILLELANRIWRRRKPTFNSGLSGLSINNIESPTDIGLGDTSNLQSLLGNTGPEEGTK